MKRLAALAFVWMSTSAMADQFYVTVRLECNEAQSELVVSFKGAWNQAAIANLAGNEWNPQQLVSFVQAADGKYSINVKNDSKSCRIGAHTYIVSVSPMLAPGFHPEGWCATRVGAMVTVEEGQKVLARAGTDACTAKGDVVTRIVVKPKKGVRYTRVGAWRFINGS